MILLEHINLVVSDIPAMLNFYQAVFPHWAVRDQGQGEWHGKARNWLHFGDQYQYIAMSDHGEGINRQLEGHQVGFAQFAYVTSDIEGVIKRLATSGFVAAKDGAEEPHRRNVYFVDPAGFEVEFVQYLSDDPALRNLSS